MEAEGHTFKSCHPDSAEQPIVPPGNQLISVLKTKGKGTEFAVNVTNPLTYLVAICSLGQINTRIDLYQVSNEDLTRCVVS